MNYKNKRREVINVIECFFDNQKTIEQLQGYAWSVIDEFSRKNEVDDSMGIDGKVFWFAIWQIQHLANEEHFKDGTLTRELKKTLEYLLNPISMPPDTYGLPPQ